MIALFLAAQAPAREFGHVQVMGLEEGLRPDAAALADLDGDGVREVLLAVHQPGKKPVRSLETWRAGKGGELARAETIALTPDVVAFAHADVRAGGGEELLLLNAGGVFVWRSGPESRPERLLACELLWQTADPESVFEWKDGVRDLDGDGLSDLVLPEPGGFLIALQRRSKTAAPDEPWGIVSRVRVPSEADDPGVGWRGERREHGLESRRDNGSFTLGIRLSDRDSGGAAPSGPLLSVDETVPAPFWLDWDADSDLDLLLQTSRHLHVWLQGPEGRFSDAPQLSLALPVVADESRELDASYSAHAIDLDGDRRADCAIFALDKRSDDVRTQGLFFTQAAVKEGPALFGTDGRPASLLVFAGFVSEPAFRDLDGDGYPELVLRTVRPDLIDEIRSASSETIDADLYVYRNQRGVLARQPELSRSFPVSIGDFESSLEFTGDLTGDGLAELVVRDDPTKVRILMLRAPSPRGPGAEKSTWSLLEKPLWELNTAKDAEVQLVEPEHGARASLFVLESAQVLWVRFD